MSPRKRSPKSYKDEATRLHSQIVRARGRCENCGEQDPTKLQCAHIISRKYARTRTDPANAVCLCASCHWHFTLWPMEWRPFVDGVTEEGHYYRLKVRAEGTDKVDWQAEVARLKAHPALQEAS